MSEMKAIDYFKKKVSIGKTIQTVQQEDVYGHTGIYREICGTV